MRPLKQSNIVCENALDRFTWRHDSVLSKIVEIAENLNSKRNETKCLIFADLPVKLESSAPKSTIPSSILDSYPCSQRPDLVVVFLKRGEPVFCSLFELTCPFDDNISIRHEDKKNRYNNPNQPQSLVSEINKYCKTKLYCFEIGCSGILTKGNKQRLREFLCQISPITSNEFKNLVYNLCRISIGCSKKIYDCRNESWDKNLKFYD